jgi:dolichol-phosphate mannosyltransferase
VVDGFSSDGTVNVVKSYRVKCITQEGKGKTGAIKTALKHVDTPYFVLMDGDATYPARDIENLFSQISDNYEVVGARKKGREHISPLNRFGNWVINLLFNLIFGTRLTDVCSGMYLLDTKFARSLELKTEGFDVEVEIAANAASQNKIAEVPISFNERLGINKLDPFRDGAKILYRIIDMGIKLHLLRFISLLEACLIIPSFLLLYLFLDVNMFSACSSSFIIGFIMLVLGVQGITLYIVDMTFGRRLKNKSETTKTYTNA